jgi:hypothetical protein
MIFVDFLLNGPTGPIVSKEGTNEDIDEHPLFIRMVWIGRVLRPINDQSGSRLRAVQEPRALPIRERSKVGASEGIPDRTTNRPRITK